MSERRRFLAGDVVFHKPTKEEWSLACDESHLSVYPSGWPATRASADDCELLTPITLKGRFETLCEVSRWRLHGEGHRAARASEDLRLTIAHNAEASPLLFIAGPYSSDPSAGLRNAVALAEFVIAAGGFPFVPHVFHLWDLIAPHPYQFWIDLDLQILRRCHGVIRLAGESKGADGEVAEARARGLAVLDLGVEPDPKVPLGARVEALVRRLFAAHNDASGWLHAVPAP